MSNATGWYNGSGSPHANLCSEDLDLALNVCTQLSHTGCFVTLSQGLDGAPDRESRLGQRSQGNFRHCFWSMTTETHKVTHSVTGVLVPRQTWPRVLNEKAKATKLLHMQRQAGVVRRFKCYYTKHKTRKSKVWSDGLLLVRPNGKVSHSCNQTQAIHQCDRRACTLWMTIKILTLLQQRLVLYWTMSS